MKKIIFILFICLSFSGIFGQDSSEETSKTESTTKPVTEEFKKWYISLQGSGGNVTAPVEKGTAASGKFGFEYRPIPYIGFGMGLSNNNLTLKSSEDLTSLLLLPILFSTPSSSSSSSSSSTLNLIFLLPLLTSNQSTNFSYNTLNLDFNFHMNKDRLFDPYIGIGLIGGSCAGASACTISGGEGRLGLQLNFGTFFTYLQGQYQALTIGAREEQPAVNFSNTLGTLGIGVRF
ncbi:MAG: hypothetical protein SFU98_08990 [Leptospiraceae bacterium]|nr:hypothetical protein [Leptospiraceae bacterium]